MYATEDETKHYSQIIEEEEELNKEEYNKPTTSSNILQEVLEEALKIVSMLV